MLKKFTVTNFKNFGSTVTLDLGDPSNYEFNSNIVRCGIVTKGMVYGINGSGKSNLGLALFDIVLHLTDKEKLWVKYLPYLHLGSPKTTVDFEYVFDFDGVELIYRYAKTDPMSLCHESLFINGQELLAYDFQQHSGYTKLAGSENMQLSSPLSTEADGLSRVKYVKSNAILQDTPENRAFVAFTSFVDSMLLFFSLDGNGYQGFTFGSESYTQAIIRQGRVQEFEAFLRKYDIDYKLEVGFINGQEELFCVMGEDRVQFTMLASTGTRSLALFYYWYLSMERASFVYIDEYDAFYHFELAQSLVELLRELKGPQIFLSTHNTDLLSNDILRPDAYFVIESNRILPLDKLTDKALRQAHNLQKMYKAGSFHG